MSALMLKDNKGRFMVGNKSNVGRKHSEESKRKMREAKLGKKGKPRPELKGKPWGIPFKKGQKPWNYIDGSNKGVGTFYEGPNCNVYEMGGYFV